MRTIVLLRCGVIAGTLAMAAEADAQRTTTTTTRDPLTKSDVIFYDVTCEVRIYNKNPLYKPDVSEGLNAVVSFGMWGLPVPNGGTTVARSWAQDITAWVNVKNVGTRLSKFQTRVNAWKPPGAWSFFEKDSSEPIDQSAQTVSLALESGISQMIGPFYLKPANGRFYFVVDATTDSGNLLQEANETNNVCRSALTVDS